MIKNTLVSSRSAKMAVYALSLLLLLTTACTRRESFPEESEEEPLEAEAGKEGEAGPAYDGQLLAQVIFDSVDYIVQRQELLQPFIKEFGDGTVVDKVMIRKVQENKDVAPAYYLVGLGMRNGAFRSMALELDVTSDNSLYLSSKGGKHMCTSSAGCGFCYFTFSGNKITGCECDSRAPGNNCEHKVSATNQLLKGARLRNSRQDERPHPKPDPKP